MDSLKDDEVEDIWKRTHKRINLANIKSVDPEGMASELSSEMRKVTKYSDQTDTLLDHGFPKRAIRIDDIKVQIQQQQYQIQQVTIKSKTYSVAIYKKGVKIAGKSVGGRFIARTKTKTTLIKRTEGKLKKL